MQVQKWKEMFQKGKRSAENKADKSVVSRREKPKKHINISAAENNWKQHYYNHTMSFRNES